MTTPINNVTIAKMIDAKYNVPFHLRFANGRNQYEYILHRRTTLRRRIIHYIMVEPIMGATGLASFVITDDQTENAKNASILIRHILSWNKIFIPTRFFKNVRFQSFNATDLEMELILNGIIAGYNNER